MKSQFNRPVSQTALPLLLLAFSTLSCSSASSPAKSPLDAANLEKRRIYVGGNLVSLDGKPVNDVIRLTLDGKLDPSFDTGSGFDGYVRTVVQAPDGSGDIVVAGTFTTYNGQPASRIVRLTSSGAISPSNGAFGDGFSAIPGGGVFALHYDSQGRLYAAGNFIDYRDAGVSRFVRILADGSQDASFTARITSGIVSEIEVAENDEVLAGGTFTSVETHAGIFGCERIVRFTVTGGLDADFNDCSAGSGFTGSTSALLSWKTHSVYVGGYFTEYDGLSDLNMIVRLNYAGARSNSFDTGTGAGSGFDNTVRGFTPESDQSLLVHGAFTEYNTDTYPYAVDPIVRLNSIGTLDETFSANLDIEGVIDAADRNASSGLIFAAGNITEINGVPTGGTQDLVFINPDGTLNKAVSLDALPVFSVLATEIP